MSDELLNRNAHVETKSKCNIHCSEDCLCQRQQDKIAQLEKELFITESKAYSETEDTIVRLEDENAELIFEVERLERKVKNLERYRVSLAEHDKQVKIEGIKIFAKHLINMGFDGVEETANKVIESEQLKEE